MFGGAGIYAEGRMFALVSGGVIYLKADAHNAPAFEREQLAPFTYATRTGRRGVMSYRRMPDRLYDDPQETKLTRDVMPALRPRSASGHQALARTGRNRNAGKCPPAPSSG